MRITFERTGGFAGVSVKTTIDTADLPSREATNLCQLVSSSDFFHLPQTMTPSQPAPDRFLYKVIVEDSDREHTILVSEELISSSLRPLIERLTKAARKR
jgi:hypothetical protein